MLYFCFQERISEFFASILFFFLLKFRYLLNSKSRKLYFFIVQQLEPKPVITSSFFKTFSFFIFKSELYVFFPILLYVLLDAHNNACTNAHIIFPLHTKRSNVLYGYILHILYNTWCISECSAAWHETNFIDCF